MCIQMLRCTHKGIAYQNEKTAQWSQLVAPCQACIILTPQHNWRYPGDLKKRPIPSTFKLQKIKLKIRKAIVDDLIVEKTMQV
jgi:hypothetical protein